MDAAFVFHADHVMRAPDGKHAKNFICNKSFFYYKYYMHLKLVPAVLEEEDGWFEGTESPMKLLPTALAEDGWAENAGRAPEGKQSVPALQPGDRVLYWLDDVLVPAVLIEAAGEDRWTARDSRHGRGWFYLTAESIVTRLPRPDLLGEAAA